VLGELSLDSAVLPVLAAKTQFRIRELCFSPGCDICSVELGYVTGVFRLSVGLNDERDLCRKVATEFQSVFDTIEHIPEQLDAGVGRIRGAIESCRHHRHCAGFPGNGG